MLITCADGSLHVTMPAFHGACSAATCNSPPRVLMSVDSPFSYATSSPSSSTSSHVTIVAWLGFSSIAAAAAGANKSHTLLVSNFAQLLPHITDDEAPADWKGAC